MASYRLMKMNKKIIMLILNLFLGLVQTRGFRGTGTSASGTFAPEILRPGRLIFEDNFDRLDLKIWRHENTLAGSENSEFQWYTNNRSNSYVLNGILHIRPTFVSEEYNEEFLTSGTVNIRGYDGCTDPAFSGCGKIGSADNMINPIKTASIRTIESFSFKHGKVEIRAQVPTGNWLSSAICLLPKYNFYGGWPASGQIDLMQSWGNQQYTNVLGQNLDVRLIVQGLHWGPNSNYDRNLLTRYERYGNVGYDSNYHKYQLEWTPDYLKFSIDDTQIGIVTPGDAGFWQTGNLGNTGTRNPWSGGSKMAPFDQEFYIALNLAVGGATNFPDDPNIRADEHKPWKNRSPTATADFWSDRTTWEPTWNRFTDSSHLKIDYVKVWAL